MNYYRYYHTRLYRQGRPMWRKKIGNNTWAEYTTDYNDVTGKFDDTYIAIRYHVTVIAKLYQNGDVQLFTDGYRTHATKSRLNDLGSFHLWQENYQWYVADHGADFANKTEFFDGVKFDINGVRINEIRDITGPRPNINY